MSDENRRTRGGRHFGFNGPRKRPPVMNKEVSDDDILDSLSRRAQLVEKLHPIESTMEDELEERFVPEPLTTHFPRGPRQHSFSRYTFVLMLAGGLVIVGLYGALKAVTDPSSLLGMTSNPTFKSVFTDPLRLGLVIFFSLIPMLIVHRRRTAQNRSLKL